MDSLVIIHFAPVELYPPAQNLLNELVKKGISVSLITTTNLGNDLRVFTANSDQLKIIRIGKLNRKMSFLSRMRNYIIFYTASFLMLIIKRPANILYFETLSSFPACIYKKYIRRNVKLYVHYHEYTSPEQYRMGMKLEYYFHRFERKLYHQFDWISHTNKYRMSKFEVDILPVRLQQDAIHILPNYPPRSWSAEPRSSIQFPLKVIYIGALSLTTMYTKEFAEWVYEQDGRVIWDIFSYNYSREAREYVQSLNSDCIRMQAGVDYEQLPGVLRKYDIGVVLYNGHIPNYVHNAPNKLFEYLVCGLDVWFPDVITGSLEFVRDKDFPKVSAIDFTNLKDFKLTTAIERRGIAKDHTFFCEDALLPLIGKLSNLLSTT